MTPALATLKSTLLWGVVFFALFGVACGGSLAPAAPISGPTVPALTAPPTAPPTVAPTSASPTPGTTQPNDGPSDDLVSAGRALFTGGGGCLACHTIEGTAQGILGPDQTHVGTWAANRIPGYTAEQYIRESIVEPCAYNVTPADDGIEANYDCKLMEITMKSIFLSDAEIDALVAFLLAQK